MVLPESVPSTEAVGTLVMIAVVIKDDFFRPYFFFEEFTSIQREKMIAIKQPRSYYLLMYKEMIALKWL